MDKKANMLIRVVLLIVFVIAMGFLWRNYNMEQGMAKQKILGYQLQLLREGVNTYKIINNKNPDNLLVLLAKTYVMPGSTEKRTYVFGNLPVSSDQILDPFGNPFEYNKTNGWVSSSSPGFKNW